MIQPANDVCRHLGDGKYMDIVWCEWSRWASHVAGRCLGYFATKRRAKKAAQRYIKEHLE